MPVGLNGLSPAFYEFGPISFELGGIPLQYGIATFEFGQFPVALIPPVVGRFVVARSSLFVPLRRLAVACGLVVHRR
jgi:hypothetical protein